MSEYDKQQVASLKRDNARLQARIRELESGKSEPVEEPVKKKSKR